MNGRNQDSVLRLFDFARGAADEEARGQLGEEEKCGKARQRVRDRNRDRQTSRQTDRQIKRERERERGAGLTPANSTKKVGVSLEVSAKVATMSNGSWNTYSVPIMPSIQLLRAVVTRSGRIARRRIKRSKSESCFW